mgnify:CR=1 FL=1
MVGSSLDDNKPCEVASHLRVQMLSYELNPQNQKTYKLLIPVYVMKKEESKEKKSLLDKLTIPVIIVLAIGLAFLLTVKKKLITLLTGLATADASSIGINTLIVLGVVVLIFLLFYKFKSQYKQ